MLPIGLIKSRRRRITLFIAAAFACVVALVAGRPQLAAAQISDLSEFEELLRERGLEDLSTDRPQRPITSPLDRAREDAEQTRREGLGSARDVRAPADLSLQERERLLRYCEGSVSEEEMRRVELSGKLSRIERDYCRRVGTYLEQYGYEIFGFDRTLPTMATGAVSPEYVLGVGDELVVTLYGQVNESYTIQVDREGRVVLPELEPVVAAGRTFGEFRDELTARVRSSFIETKVFVSLANLRSISVMVVGEVSQPGALQLTSYATAIDALALSGGIKKTGSLRKIRLERHNRIEWIDIYEILGDGATRNQIALNDGDRIIVPPIGATIAVSGEVKRPGIYELPEGRERISLRGAVELAAGPIRPKGNRYISITFDSDGRQAVRRPDSVDAPLDDGTALIVALSEDIQEGSVELLGHVRVPGRRALSDSQTVAALIGDTASLKPNAYLLAAVLESENTTTQTRRYYSLSLADVLAGRVDYRLHDRDRLIVLDVDDVRYMSSPAVARAVRGEPIDGEAGAAVPANLIARGALPAEGRDTPETTKVCSGLEEVARIVAAAGNQRFAVATGNLTLPETERDDRPESRCPEIFDDEPHLLAFLLENAAALNGEVRHPGLYPVAPDTPLDRVIETAGGRTDRAGGASIEITRRTQVDGAQAGIERTQIAADGDRVTQTAIGPGTSIFVQGVLRAREKAPVTISGEVLRPGTYDIAKGERLSALLARAGGLTELAYPYGTIFTRRSVAEAQRRSLQQLSRQILQAQAQASVEAAQEGERTPGIGGVQQLLEQAEPLGRIVVEADPSVLLVRPDLDIILEAGDRIHIPKRPLYVLVLGQVLNPGALQFRPDKTVEDYIDEAGGFEQLADEGRVFAVYPDGRAERVSLSFWSTGSPQLPPGSAVVVPPDLTPLDPLRLAGDITQILSQLSVTAASLAVISRD